MAFPYLKKSSSRVLYTSFNYIIIIINYYINQQASFCLYGSVWPSQLSLVDCCTESAVSDSTHIPGLQLLFSQPLEALPTSDVTSISGQLRLPLSDLMVPLPLWQETATLPFTQLLLAFKASLSSQLLPASSCVRCNRDQCSRVPILSAKVQTTTPVASVCNIRLVKQILQFLKLSMYIF